MKSLLPILRSMLILLGLACFAYAGFEGYNGAASPKWPTSRAHIDDVAVKTYNDKWGKEHEQASVRYHYSVSGRTYVSDRIQFGWQSSPRSDSGQDVLAAFQKSEVVAFYNPSSPGIACLRPGVDWLFVSLISIMGLLCIFNNGNRSDLSLGKSTSYSQSVQTTAPQTLRFSSVLFWIAYIGTISLIAHLVSGASWFELHGIPQAVVFVAVMFFGGLGFVMAQSTLPLIALYFLNSGHLALSEKVGRFSVGMMKLMGPVSLEAAFAVGLLSEIMRARSKYKEAHSLAAESLDICERHREMSGLRPTTEEEDRLAKVINEFKKNDFTEPMCREALASILCDYGRYTDALKESKKAVEAFYKTIKEAENTEFSQKGSVGSGMGLPASGADLALVAAKQTNKGQATDQIRAMKNATASCLQVQGRIYNQLQMLDEAESVLKKALKIRQEVTQSPPWYAAAVLSELAQTYYLNNHFEESKQAVNQALGLIESQTNRDSELVLADLIVSQSKLLLNAGSKSTEEKLNEALKLQQKWLGEDHLDIAETLMYLGQLRKREGKLSESRNYYRRAQEMVSKWSDTGHPLLARLAT